MPYDVAPRTVTVVAITGTTNSGKTTLANALAHYYKAGGVIHQDDFFRPETDPSHVRVKGFINWEAVEALNLTSFAERVSTTVKTTQCAGAASPLVIIEGLHILDLDFSQYDGKWKIDHVVFLDWCVGYRHLDGSCLSASIYRLVTCGSDQDTCRQRRETRWYGSSDPDWYFEECLWPAHERQVELAHQAVLGKERGSLKLYFIDANQEAAKVLADVIGHLGTSF